MVVSVRSVAERAGVSISSVSRALRDMPGLSEETRKRVRDAAAELGYVASPTASRLATGRTRTIAVVVPEMSKWFFAEVIGAAGRVLGSAGYDVLLTALPTPEQRAAFFGQRRLQGRTDGAIVVALQLTPDELGALTDQGQTISLVGSAVDGVSHVHVDDRAGGHLATRHLVNLGHTRIAFLGIATPAASTLGGVPPEQRRLGYLDVLGDAGIPLDPALEVLVENTLDAGAAAAASLLSLAEPPTAIVAASDELAFGVLKTVHAMGLSAPDDVSVIGYDDHAFAAAVGLTTIDHSVAGQGRIAAESLLAAIDGDADPVASGVIEPRLVVRGTTAPPRDRRRGIR